MILIYPRISCSQFGSNFIQSLMPRRLSLGCDGAGLLQRDLVADWNGDCGAVSEEMNALRHFGARQRTIDREPEFP